MRLTCPNCGAQYEVAADVIPENGRDVQCSSCGNTWFQNSEKSENIAAEAPEKQPEPEMTAETSEAETVETVPESDEISDEQSQEMDSITAEPDITDEPAIEDHTPATPGLDEGVADILRQEAERETAERTKGDDHSTNITDPISSRFDGSDQSGDGQVDVDMSDMAMGARSELLPDIEEINSTLAADETTEEGVTDAVEGVAKSKNGFRRGFISAVVVFAVLALVYVFARQLANAVPALAPALASYVEWVNQLRETVDGLMLRAVDKLTGLLAQLNSDS